MGTSACCAHDVGVMYVTDARRATDQRVVDVAAVLAGVGFGVSVALPILHTGSSALAAPGGVATVVGSVTAMAGSWLLMIMVLLAGRIPAIEAAVGQDRLVKWHRLLGPWPITLLAAHAVATTVGYAQAARTGVVGQIASLLTTYQWVFAATVAFAVLVVVGMFSARAVRRRVSYETWWVVHLYTYLAIAFALPHQFVDGLDFVGHPLVRAWWILAWAATAGVVVTYRLGLPVLRSLRHQLRVVAVRPEGPGVVSVVLAGRRLDRLPVAGGQYFGWRFLTRDLWWQAHPFSLSAMPTRNHLRVTIKVLGEGSTRITRLRPGTRVAMEGPYGAFTESSRTRPRVALVGAGVGVTPLRALLEDLAPEVDVVMVVRAPEAGSVLFRHELVSMVAARGGRFVELTGPRRRDWLSARGLATLVPDLGRRDVYVCGPKSFADQVVASARRLGVPAAALHREVFEF